MPRQAKKQPSSSFSSFKKIAIGFIVLAIILLVVIVYFSFAKATIILSIDQEPKTLSFDLSLVSLDSELSGDLTGRIISQEMQIGQEFNVQNYKEESGMATGKIRIINNHTNSQPLVRTTRFLSPQGILFRLTDYVNVPAGGEIVADVYADGQGAEYNIEPTQFTIPGLSTALQAKIYGVSDTAMTGGIKKVGVLTQQDVDAGQTRFLEDLSQNIKDNLNIELEIGEEIRQSLIQGEILKQSVSEKTGEEVESFKITAQVLAKVILVNYEDMLSKVKEIYKEKLAGQIQVTNWDLDEFDYTVESVDLENKSAVISASLTAHVQGSFDVENFDKTEISGFDQKGVEYYFSQYPSIKNVEVKFWPFWVRSIPALADRIEIVVE